MLFLLALAVAAATAWPGSNAAAAPRAAATGFVILAVVTVEAWQGPVRTVAAERVPAVYRPPARRSRARRAGRGALLSGHAIFENGEYVYNSTAHWRPVMNGYSGYTPASYRRRAASFWFFPENWAIDAIKSEGATHLMVHLERFGREAEAVKQAIARRPTSTRRSRSARTSAVQDSMIVGNEAMGQYRRCILLHCLIAPLTVTFESLTDGECSSMVEHRTVAPVVAGSIPVTHPNFHRQLRQHLGVVLTNHRRRLFHVLGR